MSEWGVALQGKIGDQQASSFTLSVEVLALTVDSTTHGCSDGGCCQDGASWHLGFERGKKFNTNLAACGLELCD